MVRLAAVSVASLLLCVAVALARETDRAPVATTATIPVPEVAKSSMDPREYRLVSLPNGLDALVVSDAHTGVASASVDVGTGWWKDPEDIPGMNHFMEHMLFLGNAKYPQEGAWRSFLASHGGSSNAYTSTLNMNFYFSIGAGALPMALERFSAFFMSPSFTPSAISREINAVNSENMKNLQNDVWRTQQLVQSLSNKSLPHHKFSTGNSATLGSVSHAKLSSMLSQLFKENFVAQNMRLCVVGQHSLDVLEAMVRKEFAALPSAPSQLFRNGTKLPAPWLYPSADKSDTILPNAQGKMIKIKTVKDIRKLTLSWPMPPGHNKYDLKSLSYIASLLGNEAKGSLLAVLKRRELATHMSAGSTLQTGMFQMFSVIFQLTKKGAKPSNVDYIIEQTMKYLTLIQSKGINEWRWREDGRIQAIHFRLKNKVAVAHLASTLSARMRTLKNPGDVLIAPYVYRHFKPEDIKQDVVRLKPNKMIVVFAQQNHTSSLSDTEKWYGTKYDVSSLAVAHLMSLRNVTTTDIHMRLPGPNPFVPKSLKLKPPPTNPRYPFYPLVVRTSVNTTSQTTGSSRVWWKQDTKFKRPVAQMVCKLWSKQLYASPDDVVKGSLFTSMVRDQLSELMYPAHRAGYFYTFGNGMDGFDLSVTGYDSGMVQFVKSVASLLQIKKSAASFGTGNSTTHNHSSIPGNNSAPVPHADSTGAYNNSNSSSEESGLSVTLKVFESLKEELSQKYKNFAMGQPLSHAAYTLSLLLGSPHWHVSQYLHALETVELQDVVEWGKSVYRDTRLECLMTGNVEAEDAISIVGALSDNLNFASSTEAHFRTSDQVMRIVQVDGTYSFTTMAPNKKDPNAASYVYYQYEGEGSITDDVKVQLLANLMGKQCFHELRTKQALGYLVFCGSSVREGVNGIRVDVQSPKYSAIFLQRRISKFMKNHMRDYLRGMSPALFLQYRNGLLNSKGASYSTLAGETSSFWAQIHSQQYNFVKAHFEQEAIRKMTQKDFLKFYDELIGYNSIARRVNVQVESALPRQPPPTPTPAPVVKKPAKVVVIKEAPATKEATSTTHTTVAKAKAEPRARKELSHNDDGAMIPATEVQEMEEDPTEEEDQNLAELVKGSEGIGEDLSEKAMQAAIAADESPQERELEEDGEDVSQTEHDEAEADEDEDEDEDAHREGDIADAREAAARGAYAGSEKVAQVPEEQVATVGDEADEAVPGFLEMEEEEEEDTDAEEEHGPEVDDDHVSDAHIAAELAEQEKRDQAQQQDFHDHAQAAQAHQFAKLRGEIVEPAVDPVMVAPQPHHKAMATHAATAAAAHAHASPASHVLELNDLPTSEHPHGFAHKGHNLKASPVTVVRTVELQDASTDTGVQFHRTGATIHKSADEKLNAQELVQDERELHKEGITVPAIVANAVASAAASPAVKSLGHGVTATKETYDTTDLKSPCGSYKVKHGAPNITVVDFCNGTKVEVQTVHCPNCPPTHLGPADAFQRLDDHTCNKGGPARVYYPRPVTRSNIAAFKNGLCLFPKLPTGNFVPTIEWWHTKHPQAASQSVAAAPKQPTINVHNLGK